MKNLGSITDPKDVVTKEYVDGKASPSPYGTCSTAAATAAKTVTVDSDSFTLKTGACVRIMFSNTNSASNPTLNVNGTGAKAIKRYGTTAVSTSAASSWSAGSVVDLTYDGTYWVIHHFHPTYGAMTVAEYEAGTVTTGRVLSPANLKGAIQYWASGSPRAASARGSASSLSLSAGTITKVTLNTWIAQSDTAFTFSDGGIRCPYDGVVMVSGSVYLTTTYNVSGGCYIKKGTAEVTSQYMGGISGGISSGVVILQVSAGDIIYLNARAAAATTTIPNNNATHLDISYI